MQSSSLIFVVVVAIWAVYLLQYWIKRRDHLATIRSVDRFSAAMRVLDHHRLTQDTAEPSPRSYALAPTRSARPSVTVKRAAAPRVPVAAPVEAERDDEARYESDGGKSGRHQSGRRASDRPALVSAVVDAPRRVRGLTLLVHVGLFPLTLLLAAFGPLAWWVPMLVLVSGAAAFGWLRQAVLAEQAAERRARRAHESVARPAAARPAAANRPAPVVREAPVRAAATVDTPAAEASPRERVAASSDGFYDIEADSPAVETPLEPESVEDEVVAPAPLRPGTWQPVPVPRPTYTMKARAPRPAAATPSPAPAPAPAAVTSKPALGIVDDDLDELPSLTAPRRAVNG